MSFRPFVYLGLVASMALSPVATFAQSAPLAQRLAGRIVLQVQSRGEAWYIDPITRERYFLGSATDAYSLMRTRGLGIRKNELDAYLRETFPMRLSGRILLDVERRGAAYYVDPVTRKATSLGRAEDAYTLMRRVGLGISNSDLARIPAARTSTPPPSPVAPAPSASINASPIEREVFDRINAHRVSIGIAELAWSDAIANQARDHSKRMANGTTPFGHDGFSDRLRLLQGALTVRGIAENVAMNDFPNPAPTAVNGWIESPGHKANLEQPTYTLTGIGVAQAEDGSFYFTQLFVK